MKVLKPVLVTAVFCHLHPTLSWLSNVGKFAPSLLGDNPSALFNLTISRYFQNG